VSVTGAVKYTFISQRLNAQTVTARVRMGRLTREVYDVYRKRLVTRVAKPLVSLTAPFLAERGMFSLK